MENRKAKILLIAGDSKPRNKTKSLLQHEGYRVSVAEGGGQAFRLLAKNSYDLVVSEASLPDMTGVELMRGIRTLGIKAEVIFLAASEEWESHIDLMNMGAFDYVNESSGAVVILNTIKEALGETQGSTVTRL